MCKVTILMLVLMLQDYLSDSGIMYEVVSNLPKVSTVLERSKDL